MPVTTIPEYVTVDKDLLNDALEIVNRMSDDISMIKSWSFQIEGTFAWAHVYAKMIEVSHAIDQLDEVIREQIKRTVEEGV